MSAEASPLPWRAEQPGDECRFWTIRNPDGVSVCTAWREADAALIVAAVNGRTALAAVLLDMAKDCEAAWEGTPLRRALAKYVARLREIAGDGELPTACKFEEHEREPKR